MKTTLNAIRAHSPCAEGWRKLLAHIGKTAADDETVSVKTVIESNGIEDALWCLRAVEGRDNEIRLFAVWCARQVQHLMTDSRSIAAIAVAERFANGEASQEDLAAARDAAWDAARAASWDAARDAARDAAWDAARAAAWAAAWDAARDAARAAARAAARDAARAAARAAARDAARAAAWDAARDAQKQRLIEICDECAQKSECAA